MLLLFQGYGKKHTTLYDIRSELYHRYQDLRSPYHSPLPDAKFLMLTKETPRTFHRGAPALVLKDRFRVRVLTDALSLQAS